MATALRNEQITAAHIDFSRRYIGIAFLSQRQHEELTTEQNASSQLADDERWDGIVSYILRAVNAALLDAYKQNRSYEHAEICFWCSPQLQQQIASKDYMVACGTRMSGTSLSLRRFHDSYEWKWLAVDEAQQRQIFAFYRSQLGRRYDLKGSLQTYTAPRERTARSGWYCSELALTALKFLPDPAFHEHRANCVDTDDLYAIVCSSPLCSSVNTMIAPQQVQKIWGQNKNRSQGVQAWRDSLNKR